MIVRAGTGWQTVLADLSLILFMVTASAVDVRHKPERPKAEAALAQSPVVPALGEPVALWRAQPGGVKIADWLDAAGADPRLRLTIIAPPRESAGAFVLSGEVNRPARIVIEPGVQGLFAALTYDQPPPVARDLQQNPAKEIAR